MANYPSYDFKDRTVIVTGAGGGIGGAAAELFFKSGANVVLADLNEAAVTSGAKALDPAGKRAVALRYDASAPRDAQAAVDLATQRFGGIDFLVTSAALYQPAPIMSLSDETWRAAISVNLDGVFYITRRALPVMRKGGAIVNIASGTAHAGKAGYTPYTASKGGVLAFTRSLAREVGPGIRVNAISPGLTNTAMMADLSAEVKARESKTIPAGRFGEPEDMAQAIAFLCSDAAAYITGETLLVNGGRYMN